MVDAARFRCGLVGRLFSFDCPNQRDHRQHQRREADNQRYCFHTLFLFQLVYEAAAKKAGYESLNDFIISAIEEKIKREEEKTTEA